MVNAWSLLYDEYYGTMNENFPVKKEEPDDTVVISTGSTDSATFVNFDLNDQIENITIDRTERRFNNTLKKKIGTLRQSTEADLNNISVKL